MKEGYFVDEVWSYGLSNSYYHAQIWDGGDLDTTEIDSEIFHDYLYVGEDETFRYGSVINNQTHDSHPPLFYMVLHTISSFFPETFSKWYGLIPNIFYYVITIIFLYKIGTLFFNSKWFPIFGVLLFGFSVSAVNMVTYIRMYMLLTMWCMMFAYFHLSTIKKKKIERKDLILLFITVGGGMFSQYFFVIFAFPWVIAYAAWLIVRKEWKGLRKYLLTGGISGLSVCVIYPAYIGNVLGKNEGHSNNLYNSMHNFSNWSDNIKTYWGIVSQGMFGSILSLLIFLCVAAVVLYLVTHVFWHVQLQYQNGQYKINIGENDRKTGTYKIKREVYLVMITGFSVAVYFIIVSKIAPWLSDRYMMCVFPLIVILFCVLLYKSVGLWCRSEQKRVIMMVGSILIIGALTYYATDPQYLYANKKDNIAISEEYAETPCLYLYTVSYVMVNNALELENYEHLYQMNGDMLEDKINEVDVPDGEMVLYLDRTLGEEEMEEKLQYVQDYFGLEEEKLLFEEDKVEVYYLSE